MAVLSLTTQQWLEIGMGCLSTSYDKDIWVSDHKFHEIQDGQSFFGMTGLVTVLADMLVLAVSF